MKKIKSFRLGIDDAPDWFVYKVKNVEWINMYSCYIYQDEIKRVATTGDIIMLDTNNKAQIVPENVLGDYINERIRESFRTDK